MNDLKQTLQDIRGSAYSLEVFASQAIDEHSPEDHKKEMLDGVLMMLGVGLTDAMGVNHG